MAFEPVKESELQVGKIVPWSLYDSGGNLLLARGLRIESDWQLEQLLLRGLFRKLHFGGPPAVGDRDAGAPPSREQSKQLEDIGLAIGDMMQLQSQSGNSTGRHGVRLIGYLRGKSVLVTTPTQDGKVLLMREGQSFVVRFFSGKSVYAFSSSIHKVTNVPYPHLHLVYPHRVTGLVVRRGARARVKLIAAVQGAEGTPTAANLEDLSIGGCSLTARTPLGNKGERLRVKFRLGISQVEQCLDVEGLICNIQWDAVGDGAAPHARHGIQFANLAPNAQLALTAFVYHALHEGGVDL